MPFWTVHHMANQKYSIRGKCCKIATKKRPTQWHNQRYSTNQKQGNIQIRLKFRNSIKKSNHFKLECKKYSHAPWYTMILPSIEHWEEEVQIWSHCVFPIACQRFWNLRKEHNWIQVISNRHENWVRRGFNAFPAGEVTSKFTFF